MRWKPISPSILIAVIALSYTSTATCVTGRCESRLLCTL